MVAIDLAGEIVYIILIHYPICILTAYRTSQRFALRLREYSVEQRSTACRADTSDQPFKSRRYTGSTKIFIIANLQLQGPSTLYSICRMSSRKNRQVDSDAIGVQIK